MEYSSRQRSCSEESFRPKILENLFTNHQIIPGRSVSDLLAQQELLASDMSKKEAFPFLKWAGGKSQLLSKLAKYFPSEFKRYFEPFLGGGAVYFHLQPKRAILSDANFELINVYRVIANNIEQLILKLSSMQRESLTEESYYYIRDQDPQKMSEINRAARFIFLNKTCYNGLYRVNKDGEFNVPFGKYDKMPRLFDASNLRGASLSLRSTRIVPGYYNVVLQQFRAGEGDFVYLDPPYAVENGNGFTGYTKELFSWSEQERLAKEFSALARKGCYVMLSNTDNGKVRSLYANSAKAIIRVKADRMINCNGKRRTGYHELIILSYFPKAQTLRPWVGDTD